MADLIFFFHRHLCECLRGIVREKDRIITKPVVTTTTGKYGSIHNAFERVNLSL